MFERSGVLDICRTTTASPQNVTLRRAHTNEKAGAGCCGYVPLLLFLHRLGSTLFPLLPPEDVMATASAPPASASSSARRWSSLARPFARRRFISSSALTRSEAVARLLGARLLGPSSSQSSSSLSLLPTRKHRTLYASGRPKWMHSCYSQGIGNRVENPGLEFTCFCDSDTSFHTFVIFSIFI